MNGPSMLENNVYSVLGRQLYVQLRSEWLTQLLKSSFVLQFSIYWEYSELGPGLSLTTVKTIVPSCLLAPFPQ